MKLHSELGLICTEQRSLVLEQQTYSEIWKRGSVWKSKREQQDNIKMELTRKFFV
jgi:hypothetical protein